MQHTWKLGACVLMVTLLSLSPAAQTALQPAKPAPAGTISGMGCLEAGVEAGCLVLKDTKTNTLYNLFFTEAKPSIGMAMHFTGTAHEGVPTCMQGRPVDVKKWGPIKMHCPSPAGEKRP